MFLVRLSKCKNVSLCSKHSHVSEVSHLLVARKLPECGKGPFVSTGMLAMQATKMYVIQFIFSNYIAITSNYSIVL